MVNLVSEFFEQYLDWVICQLKCEFIFGCNQFILDFICFEVKVYVFKVIDDMFVLNLGIIYVKWDCNCYVIQFGLIYLLFVE